MQRGRIYQWFKYVPIVCCFWSISIAPLWGQAAKIDSLKRALQAAPNDTTRINILNNISLQYWNNVQLDSALLIYWQAATIAERLDDKRWLCKQMAKISNHFWRRGYLDSAFFYQMRLFTLAQQLHDDELLFLSHAGFTVIYSSLEQNEKAMREVRLAEQYAYALSNKDEISWALANIGLTFEKKK